MKTVMFILINSRDFISSWLFLLNNIHCFKRDLRDLGTFCNSAHGQLGELGVLLTLHPLSNGDN